MKQFSGSSRCFWGISIRFWCYWYIATHLQPDETVKIQNPLSYAEFLSPKRCPKAKYAAVTTHAVYAGFWNGNRETRNSGNGGNMKKLNLTIMPLFLPVRSTVDSTHSGFINLQNNHKNMFTSISSWNSFSPIEHYFARGKTGGNAPIWISARERNRSCTCIDPSRVH